MNDANDGKFIIEYLGGVGYRISDIGYLGWYRISFFLGFVTLVFKHVELKGKFPHSTLLIATILFHLLEPENTSLSNSQKERNTRLWMDRVKWKYSTLGIDALYISTRLFISWWWKIACLNYAIYTYHIIYPRVPRRSRDRFLRTLLSFL